MFLSWGIMIKLYEPLSKNIHFSDICLFVPRLGCHQKVIASPVQGGYRVSDFMNRIYSGFFKVYSWFNLFSDLIIKKYANGDALSHGNYLLFYIIYEIQKNL